MRDGQLTVFDYIDDVSNTKENLFENSDDAGESYSPWMVNRYFSYFPDTIFSAQDMNDYGGVLPPDMQHSYYTQVLEKKKRYMKWIKPEKNETIEGLGEHYRINTNKAAIVYKVLGHDVADELVQIMKSQKNGRNAENKDRPPRRFSSHKRNTI